MQRLKIFQWTPQWVLPTPNPRYRQRTKAALRRWPVLNGFAYRFWQGYIEHSLGRAVVEPRWQRRLMSALCEWNLRLSVRDAELRRKLTPDYQAIQRPGVDVVTDHVERGGVITADGTLHELDMLVLATGFDARAYVAPMTIVGESGRTLAESWHDGPTAYRSVAVPGFPNLFMMMGPHSPIGNQSLVPIAEDQATTPSGGSRRSPMAQWPPPLRPRPPPRFTTTR